MGKCIKCGAEIKWSFRTGLGCNICKNCYDHPPLEEEPLEEERPRQLELIDCPACHKQVSAMAMSCPQCGHPINQQNNPVVQTKETNNTLKGISLGLGLLFLGIFIKSCAAN
jgi:hypothetical protein